MDLRRSSRSLGRGDGGHVRRETRIGAAVDAAAASREPLSV